MPLPLPPNWVELHQTEILLGGCLFNPLPIKGRAGRAEMAILIKKENESLLSAFPNQHRADSNVHQRQYAAHSEA